MLSPCGGWAVGRRRGREGKGLKDTTAGAGGAWAPGEAPPAGSALGLLAAETQG